MDTPTFVEYVITPLSGSTASTNAAAISLLDSRFLQAQNALNDLSSRIENLTTKSAIIRQHVPLADGVFVGSLVYYDTGTAKFTKAQALTLAETGASGQTIEAPQARVEGIVVATDIGSDPLTGTLLCGGYWIDTDVALGCLGSSASPGTYYLSPSVAGMATKETYGHLRQPVLTYYGNGGISLNIFYMAHDNHFHASQVLDGQWIEVAGSTVSDLAPANARYYYAGVFDYGIGAVGDTTALFYNGELQDTWSENTAFKIVNNIIWYCDAGLNPSAGKVVIFNHYPFAYDTAVVRSVTSVDDAITVTNTNGMVSIKGNDFVVGPVAKSSYAVSAISGKELSFTPIITDMVAGPGMTLSKALDGSVYLSAADRIGSLMDAYSINHNGTTLISNGTLQYITFPAGRISSFVMIMPVTDINTPCAASIWGMKLGENSASLTVVARFIPDPTVNTQSSVDTTRYTEELTFNAGTDDSSLVYGEALINGCTVSGSGLLVASVGVDSGPADQIQLLRTGFKLDVINSNVEIGTDMSDAITQQFIVGDTAIEAGTAVMILNNALVPCVNMAGSLNDTTNKCVGVAINGAAAGETLTYMITGTMTLVTGATPGQSLYIGTDGKLTTVADTDTFLTTARYLQKVGTVLTGNKIQVNIESAVKGNA